MAPEYRMGFSACRSQKNAVVHDRTLSDRFKFGLSLVVAGLFMALPLDSRAQSAFEGFYFGTTSGECESGEFGFAVRSNGTAIVFQYDPLDEVGGVTTNVTIQSDGSFVILNIDGDGTNVSGTIAGSTVSGTIDEIGCNTGSFTGTKAACGTLAGTSGFYSGTSTGTVVVVGEGTDPGVTGEFHLLVSEDGQSFGYGDAVSSAFMTSLDDGGTLSTAANGVVSGTFVLGSTIAGNLNLDTGNGSGTSAFSGELGIPGAMGSINLMWTVSRVEPIACPEPELAALGGTALMVLALVQRQSTRRSSVSL